MNTNIPFALALSLLTATADASDVNADPAEQANAAVTATAAAATADASQEIIARVTVSTRRRNETSQSVPTTMSVLDANSLENNRVYRVQDLQPVSYTHLTLPTIYSV